MSWHSDPLIALKEEKIRLLSNSLKDKDDKIDML